MVRLISFLLCTIVVPALADADEGTRVPLVAAGSTFSFSARSVPLPTVQLGRIAALAGQGQVDGLPAVRGASADAAPPPGWPAVVLVDGPGVSTGRAPFDGTEAGERCQCKTVIGTPADERIAVLFATTSFHVASPESIDLLEVRVDYRAGLALYLNGQELARRNLDDPEPTAPARRSRGVEWETFYVPARAGLLVAGDNVLAVEVRPSGDELVPRLDLEVRAVENSRIVRGPLIQRVTDTSAVVIFETDLPTRGAVEVFAEDGNTEAHVTARGALAVRHRVRLEGLTPATVVRYRVRAGASVTEGFSFHTAPRVGAVVRFAVYGDMRGGHRVHESITSRVLDEAPDFVVVTGDLVVRGTDEGDWQRFFSVARKLLASGGYYPVAGNHDVGRAGDEQRRMNEIFELWPAPADRPEWGHWYSFDVADVHFVMLDSNSYEHIEQLRWLEDDLKRARARGVRAIFAATHDGPYSRGLHRGNRYMAEHYAPVLAKAKVALIFSGHDHLYQRGAVNGLDYMVSGGGGAPLYSVRCGAPGRSRCAVDDGMKKVLSEHHYITVAVYSRHIEACVRRPDRTLIEPCWKKRL